MDRPQDLDSFVMCLIKPINRLREKWKLTHQAQGPQASQYHQVHRHRNESNSAPHFALSAMS